MQVGRVIRYILLALCLAGEGLLALICIMGILMPTYDIDNSEDRLILLSLFIPCVLCGAVSVGGMVRQALGRRWILRCSAMMKLTILSLGLTLLISVTPPFVPGATVTFGLMTMLLAATAVFIGLRSRRPPESVRTAQALRTLPRFTALDTTVLRWGMRRTYAGLRMCSPEELSAEEAAASDRYAAMPAAYLLMWLVRRGYMSDAFTAAYPVDRVGALISGFADPADFLIQQMQGVLRREDIAPQCHGWLDRYFGADGWGQFTPLGLYTPAFRTDYDHVVLEDGRQSPCTEFSEAHCRLMEEKLDKRFAAYRYAWACVQEAPCAQEVYWPLFDAKVKICVPPDVPPAYIRTCVQHLLQTPGSLAAQMLQQYCGSHAPMQPMAAGKPPAGCFFPDSVLITPPLGEEPAYQIFGETLLDEEHGFSCTVRGAYLLGTAQYGGTESPWTPRNRLRYALLTSPAASADANITAALDSGQLLPVTLPDGVQVLLPPAAVPAVQEGLAVMGAMRRSGRASSCTCVPVYNAGGRIPAAMRFTAVSGNCCVFYDVLHILP